MDEEKRRLRKMVAGIKIGSVGGGGVFPDKYLLVVGVAGLTFRLLQGATDNNNKRARGKGESHRTNVPKDDYCVCSPRWSRAISYTWGTAGICRKWGCWKVVLEGKEGVRC